ncbi:single-stranded DNA-binding protein [Edaphobacter modestus]|uniref:Single-stranded DNA-binding protein n=1 Tax=Edaphobacter modestus TaxID=388466 RepID=A0A4Q7XZZ0_9BACT|nr:single-stranded DNA-binding protein [Edaphobacter modestus]RZU29025.1 single-strand binding protein [Edaphobacter modestus]
MAQGVNKVILMGYVGKNREIRNTNSNTLAANFSLATSKRRKERDGKVTERTEWHNIVGFARVAELVRDYVKKGTLLYLEGELETRSWDDKQTGQKQYRTQIVVSRLNLLPSGNRNDSASSAPDSAVSHDDESSMPSYSDDSDADSIPF